MTEEKSILLSLEEVEKRKQRRSESVIQKPIEDKKESKDKFYNRGGTVAINYETMGRFNIPSTLYFKDFSTTDESDLLLTRDDDLLETTINILNKLKNQDAKCDVGDMLKEEFFETLIGIKKQFDTTKHTHLWICDCQDSLPSEDQKVNETEIDLTKIEYKSITEADEILKNYYKDVFANLSESDWTNYIAVRYKDNPSLELENLTKEQEIGTIQIKEPFLIKYEHTYAFRFSRIGDLVKAKKLAVAKFAPKFKELQTRKNPNGPLTEIKLQRQEELNKLKEDQGKYEFLVSRALTLLKVDDKELNDNEKIEIFSKLPRAIDYEMRNFLSQFKFGIQHEQEFTCPICGKVDKRLLQREIFIYELLPTQSITKRDNKLPTRSNIYVGV